jgi:hypothetical protein
MWGLRSPDAESFQAILKRAKGHAQQLGGTLERRWR